MQTWIIYTFLYALFSGLFQSSNKKAREKNSTYEVLAGMALIAFVASLPINHNVFAIDATGFAIVVAKSIFVILALLLGLYAMFQMPLSLYSVINLGRIIFTILLSILVLGEKLTLTTFIGMLIVLIGVLLVNAPSKTNRKKETSLSAVLMLLAACFFNACSATTDKLIMSYMTPGQVQFWFLLFLTIGYWILLLSKRKKINYKQMFTNPWVYVAGLALAYGDQFIFRANAEPDCIVTVMTLIKQVSAVEMILLGKLLFKEKGIGKKLACSTIIIAGIALTLI
ncbi:MAG: EamA family transporter [Clostridia bacterium]|nr:EamA family transporter [Clostridia bacterium]